ncbi:hypothetical protein [Thermococcus thermotolerans]|uniref:hypothetical protein n=1 Tax=Thermococcus thermotolerans TaxID=2969672 RepID=UPI0021571135|nr:hypothetical protein [Thermococcus thermotolerans]
MRIYSFGTETVPVAMAGDLVVGSVHDGKSYRIMLAKLKGDEIVETHFLAGKNDWEGHSATKLGDGYLIGGAVEGKATPEGGEGWKAYVARFDEGLNILWERRLKIWGNEAVYSILSAGEGLFIAGETGRPGKKGLFLGEMTLDGRLLWLKIVGPWEDTVISTLLLGKEGVRLIGSVKKDRWTVREFTFTREGELLGVEGLAEGIAFTAGLWDGEFILAGYKGKNLWIKGPGWEVKLEKGTATSLISFYDGVLVGGELDGNAAVLKIGRDGKILWKRELWKNGVVEVLTEKLALGTVEKEDRIVMAGEKI